MTRDEEITTLARRMCIARYNAFGVQVKWEDITTDGIKAYKAQATIAIEMAEATRGAAAMACAKIHSRYSLTGNAEQVSAWITSDECEGAIWAMPLPIADGGSGPDTECAAGETTR